LIVEPTINGKSTGIFANHLESTKLAMSTKTTKPITMLFSNRDLKKNRWTKSWRSSKNRLEANKSWKNLSKSHSRYDPYHYPLQ